MTFIPTPKGWLYLATVMDLFSRKIIGWWMGNSNSTALISQALLMEIVQQNICSMSRKGNCWGNAAMESFYHSLKTECAVFEDYRTRSQARSSLFDYIELF